MGLKNWPTEKFDVIVVDPPWRFVLRSKKGNAKSAEQYYDVMSLDDIKAMPMQSIAQRDCILFMWVIDTHLPHALEVLKAWGFTFKTVGFYWDKRTSSGLPWFGQGFWTRAGPEQCWIATRGSPKRVGKGVQRRLRAEGREHSRKPDKLFALIERLMGPKVSKIELFAREERPGWAMWGNETDYFA